MLDNLTEKNKKNILPEITQSSFSSENDTFTSLSTSALLAKNSVPYSHRRAADNYVIIKRIYRFQVVQTRINNEELTLLKKYDFNPLEFSTIKQINEELIYLKKWAFSANEILSQDSNEIIQIRAKELKFIIASKYSALNEEIYDGYRALERYFEEITKFYK
jgi:hypothetical protein